MSYPEPRREYARVIMLGTAFDTCGGVAAVVNAYRAQGLFRRCAIEYIATHRDGGALRKLATAARALRVFVWTLIKDGPAVLHVHVASHASFRRKAVFMALGMLAGCPVIFHLHGGGFRRFYESECSAAGRRAIRFFLDRAACVVVLSARRQAWLSQVTANPRIVRVPNPAPEPAGHSGARSRHTVLFLGRLSRDKGVFDLLEAFGPLRATLAQARLVCAGDGDRAAVAAHAARLGIADAVELPGWAAEAEKRALMDRAALFVLPSYVEGMPMSLLEAMAHGLPVLATDVGAIPDVVSDGVDGFLFAPGDCARLEQLLRAVLTDPALAARVGAAARATVRRRCGAEQVLGRIEAIYAGVGLTRPAALAAQ